MITAAFSQWRTISTFHLFICSNLASTIPIFNSMAIGVIDPRSNQSLLQRAYFIFYGMLRLAISAYLIYRFRFWGNTPGQCFVIPHALPHIDVRVPLILGTALRIAWDLLFTAVLSLQLTCEILGWSEAKSLPLEASLGLKQESSLNDMKVYAYLGVITFLVPFIWNAYWTITILIANRGHVLGDDYAFTVGQVCALIAFVASFHIIWSSYLSKRRVPFMILPLKKLITERQSIESSKCTLVLVTQRT